MMHGAKDRPHWKRTLVILGVMAAGFAFQETGVLPVLPVIQRQLPGASTTSSALLESGFLIVAAVAAPLIGKYGDAHGKQRMLLVTLAIYFMVFGGIGAQVAAAIMKSQPVAGSRAPSESAFAIAFGVCAVLAAIGTGLAWSVPTDREVSRS